LSAASFAYRGGATYESFKKDQGKYGKDRSDQYRAAYEQDKKQRMDTKLNWGIKNRWEQRALDEVIKNKDVRKAQFRDLASIKAESYAKDITDFHSVDEIYFFMERMFTEGFDEKHMGIALDVFLRDFGQFEEKDLEKPMFKQFLRELGVNLISFKDEKNFVKTARFLDWYCVTDTDLWVNLEQFVVKKEHMFKPESLVTILSHFSAQQEGSRDFYDFIEFCHNSQRFKGVSTHELITMVYSFYSVHAGTTTFMNEIADSLLERLNDKVSTYDLLRVLQTYSEISKTYPKLFL
jgi:hypothetical protein